MDEQHLADLVARLDQRLRRFPAGASCAGCGEQNPLLLTPAGKKLILCHRCRILRRGRSPVERHHPGGRPGSVTVEVPVNLHVELTWLQELWRGSYEPGSNEAQLFDLAALRILGPSHGVRV